MPARTGQERKSSWSAYQVRNHHSRAPPRKNANKFEGAFTPGCQAYHLPPYIQKASELKSKGVDIIAVIASNDAWVMNAWGKVNKVAGDDIVGTTTK